MEEHPFFKHLKRFNLILLAVLLMGLVVGMLYGFVASLSRGEAESPKRSSDSSDHSAAAGDLEDFHLSGITRVNPEVQYLSLISDGSSAKRLLSDSYGSGVTRNLLFMTGSQMQTHWLLDNDSFQIDTVDLLKTSDKSQKVVAIYYQIRKEDSDHNQRIDYNDSLTLALSTPAGNSYQELDKGITAVMDHQLNAQATELTVLVRFEKRYYLKKYDLKSGRQIAATEIKRAAQ